MTHWTVAKMMEGLPSPYKSDYEPNYVDAETTPHPSNNAKIAQMLQDGYWQELSDFFDEMEDVQNHYKTMTGATLTAIAHWWGVDRDVDETDAELRVRFSGRLQRLLGEPTPDAIQAFVEGFLGAEEGDVDIIENAVGGDPANGYEPASFYVSFDFALLDQLGIAPSKWPTTIDAIDEILDFLAAAGVRGQVLVTGGAQWDAATWDEPGDVWGT